jgi:uncharacterized protein YecT (DUF1311 family)
MATPEAEDKPAPSPLDAERAKLRQDGYTDAEISQILIARAAGGSEQSIGAGAQGVLSNVLSSLVAVSSHARAALPSFRRDVATIFDGTAPAPARAGASASLVVKVVVIAVLGYAAWQEWRQHVISATEIAAANAKKAHAEECSARIKAIIDSVPMNKILEATDIVQRDCDPTYAARTEDCDKKFQAILNDIDHMDGSDPTALSAMTDKVNKHKSECVITDEQREAAATKAKKSRVEGEKANKAAAIVGRMREIYQIKEAHEAGNYAEALRLSNAHVVETEAEEIKTNGNAGKNTASALANLSWEALFARDFKKAHDAAARSSNLDSNLVPETNRAHALMLLGRTAEAKDIYLAHKGETLNSKKWERVIAEDFALLRKAGITDPIMTEIEAALGNPGQPPASTTEQAAVLPSPTPVQPSPPSNLIEAVTSDQLTLRTQPDKSAEAIVVLNKGAQVEVISTDANGWSQVQLSDQGTIYKGYVNGKYLTPFTIVFPTPVILTEPTDRDEVPSYCGHESAPMEFVICSNSALALQDSAMAKSYRILLARVSDPEALRSSQRQWNKDRRLNCNVASSGRPARQIPANIVQCVMTITEARKLDLRAGRY